MGSEAHHNMISKPILCLDFDGVCHQYISPWTKANVISDPPVEGLFEFLQLASQQFEIHIFSSRSHQEGGKEAMMEWFAYCAEEAGIGLPPLHFPENKPPALITLDDRVLLFKGEWPNVDELRAFRPWNRK